MEQCNACVDPQGEGKTSCQDRKSRYFIYWTWVKIGHCFWWFLFSVVLLSDYRVCNFPECNLWQIWEPVKVEPEQLQKSIKLWATHTALDASLSLKSHFFFWDWCAVNQAYRINLVIQHVKRRDGSTTISYTHLQQTGNPIVNLHRCITKSCFTHAVGWFVYQGRKFFQYEFTIIWQNGELLTFFPSGYGYPEDGNGPPIPFPYLQLYWGKNHLSDFFLYLFM